MLRVGTICIMGCRKDIVIRLLQMALFQSTFIRARNKLFLVRKLGLLVVTLPHDASLHRAFGLQFALLGGLHELGNILAFPLSGVAARLIERALSRLLVVVTRLIVVVVLDGTGGAPMADRLRTGGGGYCGEFDRLAVGGIALR